MVNNIVTEDKLNKYFSISKEAIEAVKKAGMDKTRQAQADDFFDMALRYYSDALHFRKNDEWVMAFAALNYAHGWLDAGARSGLFKVKDSRLFTVDDE